MVSLCDGVVRFLQELPGPVVPPALQMEMVNAVKGQHRSKPAEKRLGNTFSRMSNLVVF